MEKLLSVISTTLGSRIEEEFKKHDIWSGSFSDVRVKLNECMRICRSWKDRVTELTREIWRSGAHRWEGKPHQDAYLDAMIQRITEIFEIRSQHDELLRLLSVEELQRHNVDSTFNPFRCINAFHCNEY